MRVTRDLVQSMCGPASERKLSIYRLGTGGQGQQKTVVWGEYLRSRLKVLSRDFFFFHNKFAFGTQHLLSNALECTWAIHLFLLVFALVFVRSMNGVDKVSVGNLCITLGVVFSVRLALAWQIILAHSVSSGSPAASAETNGCICQSSIVQCWTCSRGQVHWRARRWGTCWG